MHADTTHSLDGQHQYVDRTHRIEDSIRMREDRDKWRKYVHGVANLGSRTAKEQNRVLLRYILTLNITFVYDCYFWRAKLNHGNKQVPSVKGLTVIHTYRGRARACPVARRFVKFWAPREQCFPKWEISCPGRP